MGKGSEKAVHLVTVSQPVPLPLLHLFPSPGRVGAPFPPDLILGCPHRPGFWGTLEQSTAGLESPCPKQTKASPMVSSPNRAHGLKLPQHC